MVHTKIFPALYRLGDQTIHIDTVAPQGKIAGYDIRVEGGMADDARKILTTLLQGLNQYTSPLDPPSPTGIFLRRAEGSHDISLNSLNTRMLQMGAQDITQTSKRETETRWAIRPVMTRRTKLRKEESSQLFDSSSWSRE